MDRWWFFSCMVLVLFGSNTIHDSSRYMPGGVCEATDKVAAFRKLGTFILPRCLPGGICEATHVQDDSMVATYMYETVHAQYCRMVWACASDAAQGLTEELDLCAPRSQGLRQALEGVNTRIRLPRPRPLSWIRTCLDSCVYLRVAGGIRMFPHCREPRHKCRWDTRVSPL